MRAGKSTGKRSAATPAKKVSRGKKAAPASGTTPKKKSAPAKKAATTTTAAKTSARKKPAAPEKPKAGTVSGRKAVAARKGAASTKTPAPAKKTGARTKTAAPKTKPAAAPDQGKKTGAGTGLKAAAAGKTVTVAKAVKAGLTKRRAAGAARTRRASPAKEKTASTGGREIFPAVLAYGLPREYGEDDITAIVVDPREVFAHWEVGREHLGKGGRQLVVRVEESRGNGLQPRRNDIPVLQRVGSGFFPLTMPGGSTVLSIGTVGPGGRFRPIAATGRLTTPVHLPSPGDEEQAGMPPERVGY